MESYAISVDTQSNFAYYEYDLRMLVAFLTNPYIAYGAGGQTKNLQKVPASLPPVFSDMVCYQSDDRIVVHKPNYGLNFIELNVYN